MLSHPLSSSAGPSAKTPANKDTDATVASVFDQRFLIHLHHTRAVPVNVHAPRTTLLNIQPRLVGVRLNKAAPRCNFIAHEHIKDSIRFSGIVVDVQETSATVRFTYPEEDRPQLGHRISTWAA